MTNKYQRVQDVLRSFDEQELWREVEGWTGYLVSSWGRMKGPRGDLQPVIAHGYEKITLSNGGFKKARFVHRIVAHAFLGEPPFERAVVAHNDGNQRNNRASNLRWASCKENQEDRIRHGTRTHGADVHNAKLTDGDIPVIRARIKGGERYKSIANDFGVSIHTISLIRHNKIWKHVGGASWQ